MDLALSISLKPAGIAPGGAEDVAELDGQVVLEAVVGALSLLGKVRVWDTASLTAAEIASQRPPDLIFNMAEGSRGTAREAQAPSLFEWLGWRYVGSDPVTLAITLDKWYTKSVLRAAGVPVPRGFLASRPLGESPPDLRFPLIVKPVAEGSSMGIFESSVVETEQQLRQRVEAHLRRYRQPALVEEYLAGREYTLALLGNSGCWRVLPIVEIDFSALKPRQYPLYGYDLKWGEVPSENELSCPAHISDDLQKTLEATAVATCEALRIRDWARIDIRVGDDGTPKVLEVNALPGILPGSLTASGADVSAFTVAARNAGFDYPGMIHQIVRVALDRYGSSG